VARDSPRTGCQNAAATMVHPKHVRASRDADLPPHERLLESHYRLPSRDKGSVRPNGTAATTCRCYRVSVGLLGATPGPWPPTGGMRCGPVGQDAVAASANAPGRWDRAGAGSIRQHTGADTQQIPGRSWRVGHCLNRARGPNPRKPCHPAAAAVGQRDVTAGLRCIQGPAGGGPGRPIRGRRSENVGLTTRRPSHKSNEGGSCRSRKRRHRARRTTNVQPVPAQLCATADQVVHRCPMRRSAPM